MKHKAKLAGQVRHWIGIAGAVLLAGNFREDGVSDEIIGGLMALTGLVLSWTSKAKYAGEGDLRG